MSLLVIIVVLVAVGILLYLVQRIPWIDPTIKQILFWVIIVVVVIWLLKAFDIWNYLSSVHI